MKIRFIINPIAGTGKQRNIEEHIAKYLKDYEIIYTKNPGDARKISNDAVKKKIDLVIVVGGDGTINECLKSIINTNTAIGVIPCGSGNGFAYHIGMKKNIKESVKQLKKIKVEKIDSCRVNGMPFVNVAGIGFDAHIAKLFCISKKRGFINYIKLILQEISYSPQEYNIQYDGVSKKITAYMIAFANASQYGNNINISPLADIQDGLLDFVIIKKFPRWMIPFFLLQIANCRIHLSRYVEIIRTKQMRITAKDTLIHIDGESYKTENPITIDLLNQSLKIVKPNE